MNGDKIDLKLNDVPEWNDETPLIVFGEPLPYITDKDEAMRYLRDHISVVTPNMVTLIPKQYPIIEINSPIIPLP